MKTWLAFAGRVLLLAVMISLLYMVDFIHFRVAPWGGPANGWLLLMGLAQALALSWVVRHTVWSGSHLISTLFVLYFGHTFFLTHVEGVFYMSHLKPLLPKETLAASMVNGFLVSLLVAPVAALAHGRFFKLAEPAVANPRAIMAPTQWAVKLLAAMGVYLAVYLAAGALVFEPLAGQALHRYFGDRALPQGFGLFQLARGLFYLALTLPLLRMVEGGVKVASGVNAAIFALLPVSLLLVPTSHMPADIRLPHAVELLLSMSVLGWFLARLFFRSHLSVRDFVKNG